MEIKRRPYTTHKMFWKTTWNFAPRKKCSRASARACSGQNTTLIALTFVIVTCAMSVPPARATDTFTDCGGFLEAPRGVVQSPGFPGRFPAPLACRWVIHAQPEKKIVLYFTQYFLRGAFYVTEYAHYTDEQHHYGRNPLGQISFEDDIRSMVAYKRYLVLDFHLHELTNIHLRVEEYLENVFGFNITYEIVDRSERVRQETCSVTECSYLGHCMASADFSEYSCSCFPGFFGKECQYGPYCDPDKGINMCLNEGRCRYFYGSMVNVCECPPGYEGPKCEEKEDSLGEECAKLGCSDHCTRNYNGSLQCACPDGFKLDSDNVTCVEQELYRVSVGVPVVPPGPPTWNEELAKRQATVILQLSGLRSAKRFAFDGMNFTGDAYVLLFHFYVDHSELEGVKEAVGNLMRRDNLSNLTVISSSTTIKLDPEMKLLSIENYDSSPALEGKTMMVLCTARGSDRLRFRWFKDGNEFNESLTSRNAWIMRLQNEADHKQMSIFTIDGVTTYDKGEFACEIEDFGQRERKSVRIDVMPLPQVEIKPLTASLLPGQPQSFRCLSPDENMRTFSYEWLRNGQPLGEPKNGEVVEDLLPSGSRLYLTGVKKTANYTCRVVNSAGASQKQVFVFVIAPNMSDMACENSAYEGVKWNRTFGGYFDLQKCPIDTADVGRVYATRVNFSSVNMLGPLLSVPDFKFGLGGYARRDCICKKTCSWGPPNYARCHSVLLIKKYEQLEQLQLGYQQGGLSDLYDQLYEMVQKAQNRTLAGDVDMFALNIHTLLDVTLRFPALAPTHNGSSFSLQTVANFMNILLSEAKKTNEFEKRDLSVGARLVRICEIMVELMRRDTDLISLRNVTLPMLKLTVQNVTLKSLNLSLGMSQPEVSFAQPHTYTGRQLMSLSTDDKDGGNEMGEQDERQEVLHVTFAKEIIPILPVKAKERRAGEVFITPLISVIPLQLGDLADDGGDAFSDDRGTVLEFPHSTETSIFMKNTTRCLAWERRDSSQLVGTWSASRCHVIHRTANVTRCLCPVPGHYALVVVPVNSSEPQVEEIQSDTVMLVGCIVALCGLTAAILVYFVVWRHVSGDTSVIHLNMVFALASVNLVCILCLSQSHRQTMCIVGKVLLHFFQLTTFSFLLMEAIHTYVKVRSTGGNIRIQYTCAKYFLIGWGIPSVATLAVVLLSKLSGYDDECQKWCWWSVHQWQYYSFLVPQIVLIVGQVVVMSACLVCMRMWKDEWRFRDRKKYIWTAARSFILQCLLVTFCAGGVLSEVQPTTGRQLFFAFINVLLVLTVIILFLLLRPRMRAAVYVCACPSKAKQKRGASSSSFRAFVQPGRVEESDEMEVLRIQEYCTKLDRSKFTSERKQQLRFLLGSSSSGSSTSGVGSSPPTSRNILDIPLPGIRRAESAGSRSGESGRFSDLSIGPRGAEGGGVRPKEVGGKGQGKKTRGAETRGAGPGYESSRRREGASPNHHHHSCLQNPACYLLPSHLQCRDANPPDSGISEGTESDKSFQQRAACCDLDSQLSSDMDTEALGDADSNTLSLSVSPVRAEFGAAAAAGGAASRDSEDSHSDRGSSSLGSGDADSGRRDVFVIDLPDVLAARDESFASSRPSGGSGGRSAERESLLEKEDNFKDETEEENERLL